MISRMTDLAGQPWARLIRVSGSSQDEDSQRADCDRKARDIGLAMPHAREFRLHAVSAYKGTKRHLGMLSDVLAAIERGEISAVVVAHSSRLDRRDPDVAAMYAMQVRVAGGRIFSADEPNFGEPSLTGRIITLLAQEENYKHSQDLAGHVNRKFRNELDLHGGFRGSVPAGYMVVGEEKYRKRLVPDVAGIRKRSGKSKAKRVLTAGEITEAFTDASTGTSTTKLGERLGLAPESVAKLLKNQLYSTGIYKVLSHRDCPEGAQCRKGGPRDADSRCKIVQHHTTPLVDPDVQARAIAGLEARRNGDNVRSRGQWKDDFSGVLWCGACTDDEGNPVQGGRLYRYFGNGGQRYGGIQPRVRRYRCLVCGKSVHADNADAEVDRLMSARTTFWIRHVYVPGNDHAAELERVRLELAELGARGLDDDAFDAELKRLRDERKRLEALPRIAPTTRAEIADISEGERWQMLDPQERRDWLDSGELYVYAKASGKRDGSVILEFEYAEEGEVWTKDADGMLWSSEGQGPVEPSNDDELPS